jgi:endonuclease/exonuclease/phosphatase family metal-dependent hydrolase
MKFFRLLILTVFLSGCGNLPTYGELDIVDNAGHPQAGNRISVTTWNVGYGAMGADADFIADGGENMRALNAREIAMAVQDIAQKASAFGTQFLMFQELANSSFLTRNIPVRTVIEDHLDGYSKSYWEDLGVSAAPKPFQISHGMGIYGLNLIDSSSAYELPQEPKFFFLAVKRYYAAIVSEVPIEGTDRKWVLMNIHLSAFDEDADVRREQIRVLFDFAKAEYAKGNYVVMGGDWNMRISTKDFAHTTAEEHLFWVYDFPPELLPNGWQFGVDERTPTVRTLHKPYVAGENYTAIIDGFAYSPNVALRKVSTRDLEFQYTDHNPVTAVFVIDN